MLPCSVLIIHGAEQEHGQIVHLLDQVSRSFMNRNCLCVDSMCRICPGKFFTIKEETWVLGSCGMLECSGIMSWSSQVMQIISNLQIWWSISYLCQCYSGNWNKYYCHFIPEHWGHNFPSMCSMHPHSNQVFEIKPQWFHHHASTSHPATSSESKIFIHPSLFNLFLSRCQMADKKIMKSFHGHETLVSVVSNQSLTSPS